MLLSVRYQIVSDLWELHTKLHIIKGDWSEILNKTMTQGWPMKVSQSDWKFI